MPVVTDASGESSKFNKLLRRNLRTSKYIWIGIFWCRILSFSLKSGASIAEVVFLSAAS